MRGGIYDGTAYEIGAHISDRLDGIVLQFCAQMQDQGKRHEIDGLAFGLICGILSSFAQYLTHDEAGTLLQRIGEAHKAQRPEVRALWGRRIDHSKSGH